MRPALNFGHSPPSASPSPTACKGLYVNAKIFFKSISNKLKAVFANINFLTTNALVKNRFSGESSTLILEIIEISDWFNIKRFLVTMDTEKA